MHIYDHYFELSDLSPSGIIWKVKKCRAEAGSPALACSGDGYWRGRLNQKTTFAHRVVFYLVNGYEAEVVDHIDGNGLNNHPGNLRDGSMAENLQNKVVKGCSFHKRSGKYQASICVNGNRVFLGNYATEEEAHAAYLIAKPKFHNFASMERYKKC